jgi:hypothetical protein
VCYEGLDLPRHIFSNLLIKVDQFLGTGDYEDYSPECVERLYEKWSRGGDSLL